MGNGTETTAGESSEGTKPRPATGDRGLLCARAPVPLRSKTPEEKLQELIDREEIRDLTATYALRVAQGFSNADLFTDDGSYTNYRVIGGTPNERCEGRDQLNAFFIERNAGQAMPMIHNHLVDIAGDEATAMCSVELRMNQQGESYTASGYYRDRLRREGGRWKFVTRESNFFHWVPLREGWAQSGS